MAQDTAKKFGVPARLIAGVLGLVVMFSGIRQCSSGMSSASSEVSALLTRIDAVVDSGNRALLAAQPMLMTVLTDFDKLGHAAARNQDSTLAHNAGDLFGQSAAHFRNAATLTADAATKDGTERLKPVYALKVTTYNGLSQVETINQQITALILSEPGFDGKVVTDSILSLARHRDSLQLAALNAQAAATAALKK